MSRFRIFTTFGADLFS